MLPSLYNLFKIYERQYWEGISSYEIDPNGKWRLKFINYKTGFKRKNNENFHLNTTYFATQHLSEKKFIRQNERFAYNDILENDIFLLKDETKLCALNGAAQIYPFINNKYCNRLIEILE